MICSVPVGQTEIKVAGNTDTGDQLFLLTLRLVALVGEDFLFLFALTVFLYVGGHGQVRNCTTWYWNWGAAEGANGNLKTRLMLKQASKMI